MNLSSSPSTKRILRCLFFVGALVIPLVSVSGVWAHALFEHSTPVPDSVLSSSPPAVHIWFSEDLSSASKIVVWDRYRHDETTGNATIVPGQSRQLEIGLKPLAAGSYLVLWTSVSADDGHILYGSYVFSVKRHGPLPSLDGVNLGSSGQSFPDGPTLASLLAHWLELFASVVWVGAVAFGVFVLRGVTSRLDPALVRSEMRGRRALLTFSLVLLILSSTVLILVEAYGLAGNDWGGLLKQSTWSAVFSAQYGRLWIGRQALAVLALLTLIPLRRVRTSWTDVPPLILGLLYLYLFAASGHGASAAIGTLNNSHLFSISVALDWLHFIADGLWFGGQIYLAVVLIPALRLRHSLQPLGVLLDALGRFSPVAYLSVGLYIVSGAFAAKVHIPSWYDFFNSVYGKTLIIKMLLIGLMMLTSVLTVYFLRPTIRRGIAGRGSRVDVRLAPRVEGLLWWLRVNPVLGAGVLLATSVLFYYPVPFGLGPPPPAAYRVAGQGISGTVTLNPGTAGSNQITVVLHDRQGRPLTGYGVRVVTTHLDMVMGSSLGVLNPTGKPGTFSGSTDLGMGGDWNLLFLIYPPNGTSFIRLSVDVRVGI